LSVYTKDSNSFFAKISQIQHVAGATNHKDYDVQKLNETTYQAVIPNFADIPARIRVGDIDADGFPDLIITHALKADLSKTRSVIYLNKKPIQTVVTPAAQMKSLNQASAIEYRRFYEEQSTEYKLNEFGNGEAKLAAFIDIDEDGRMDVLL
jgi:hypothetical protein